MEPETKLERFLLFFAPWEWSEAQRLRTFMGPPYSEREVAKGVGGAFHHYQKFETLAALVNRFIPALEEDRAELDRDGYSSSNRSREVAALVEVLVCELYSVLDGVRRSLFGAYRKVRGVQNDRTSKLFSKAAAKAYGDGFPEDIRLALADAHDKWFLELRRLRTEVTHGETGSCRLDQESGQVSYMHPGLGPPERALVIEDVIGHINELATAVRELSETVFRHLYGGLERIENRVPCGMYQYLMYERWVLPEAILTFDSGRCHSREWFDQEGAMKCPMRMRCGAYRSSEIEGGEGSSDAA